MTFRVQSQLAEALGHVNRWYCSQAHGKHVDDPDLLLIYFIKSGGAKDFARRFDQAMGPENRWFCSQFHCRDVSDPETLWNYFTRFGQSRSDRAA